VALLNPDFAFSQNNLQDFLDCPRRFELRHLLRQPWPAVQSQPVREHEQHLRRGEIFHQLVHQHQLGIPADPISQQINDPILQGWWLNYLTAHPQPIAAQRYLEHTLQSAFGGYRLIAKYDLIAIHSDGRVTIMDWKTGLKKPSRSFIHRRVQTRLYPFLLLLSSAHLNAGKPFAAGQIELVYWFTAEPLSPERFVYSSQQADSDREYLLDLIQQIEKHESTFFQMTTDERKCALCVYRSLCDRGIKAGSMDMDNDVEPDSTEQPGLVFDQIAEIEF
jgi:hypothetical protein